VEVRTITAQGPKPILPPTDQLDMREVKWVIITPKNIDSIFSEFRSGDSKVFFALTADGYENVSLNLSDIRAFVEQQQRIIAVYEAQYDKPAK
jgi:hypothetical protein